MARVVRVLVTLTLGLGQLGAAVIAGGECSAGGFIAGCPNVTGTIGGSAVVLTGSEQSVGASGTQQVATGAQGPLWSGQRYRNGVSCLLHTRNDPSCSALPAALPRIDPITIEDVAAFVPTPGSQRMEPDGWTVAGLATNFYALTDQHVVAGTLLGRPADVRFSPTAFHWAYGDGSAATKPTKGATWAAQGLDEFEATPTSHVYHRLGDYTITLSITFSAEYRFDGGGWRPVVGTITLPANDLHLRVGTAKTVLVAEDCLANPSGPGC